MKYYIIANEHKYLVITAQNHVNMVGAQVERRVFIYTKVH